MPSAESPTRARKSGIELGETPNFASTPGSSITVPRRLSRHTTLSPVTSWARSLSGEQTTIWSTPGASAHIRTAVAIASSASNSTIGQTTIPSVETTSSASANWLARSSGMPSPVL